MLGFGPISSDPISGLPSAGGAGLTTGAGAAVLTIIGAGAGYFGAFGVGAAVLEIIGGGVGTWRPMVTRRAGAAVVVRRGRRAMVNPRIIRGVSQ